MQTRSLERSGAGRSNVMPSAYEPAVADGPTSAPVRSLHISDISRIVREMSDDHWTPPSPGLDYALADTVVADTPARLKALGDPLRLLILDLVLERAMTVTELAERTPRPKGTVALPRRRARRRRAAPGGRAPARSGPSRSASTAASARTIDVPRPCRRRDPVPRRDASRDIDLERTATDGRCPRSRSATPASPPSERSRVRRTARWRSRSSSSRSPRGGDVEYGLYLAVFPTNRLARAAGSDRGTAIDRA